MPGATAFMDILEVNYYDRYDTIPGLPIAPLATHSRLIQGKLVASKVKVLGTADTYLWSVYFYDNKGNVVREWKQHYLGGAKSATKFDDILREYTFAGQLKKETRRHHTTNAATPEVTVLTEYDYDHRGRQTHA